MCVGSLYRESCFFPFKTHSPPLSLSLSLSLGTAFAQRCTSETTRKENKTCLSFWSKVNVNNKTSPVCPERSHLLWTDQRIFANLQKFQTDQRELRRHSEMLIFLRYSIYKCTDRKNIVFFFLFLRLVECTKYGTRDCKFDTQYHLLIYFYIQKKATLYLISDQRFYFSRGVKQRFYKYLYFTSDWFFCQC